MSEGTPEKDDERFAEGFKWVVDGAAYLQEQVSLRETPPEKFGDLIRSLVLHRSGLNHNQKNNFVAGAVAAWRMLL